MSLSLSAIAELLLKKLINLPHRLTVVLKLGFAFHCLILSDHAVDDLTRLQTSRLSLSLSCQTHFNQ